MCFTKSLYIVADMCIVWLVHVCVLTLHIVADMHVLYCSEVSRVHARAAADAIVDPKRRGPVGLRRYDCTHLHINMKMIPGDTVEVRRVTRGRFRDPGNFNYRRCTM